MDSTRLGDILVARRWIAADALASAMALQAASHQPLGQILLAQAHISERQLKRALRWQRLARGALLVGSLGAAVTPALASEALRLTEQMLHTVTLQNAPVKEKAATKKRGRKAIDQTHIKSLLGAPAWTLLQGNYQLGADPQTQGMSYRAKWSSNAVKLELRYQF